MQIVRRYFDETEWELVSDRTVRKVFEDYFVDVDQALIDIRAGCTLCSNSAEYKRAEQGHQQEKPAGE